MRDAVKQRPSPKKPLKGSTMNTIADQDLHQHFNALTMNIYDTRAMLSAIEAMLFDARGHDIESILHSNGAGDVANDVQCLVTIAIERARQAAYLSAQFEPRLGCLLRSIPNPHAESAATTDTEMVLSDDEAACLESYRNASKKGQKIMRQLALRARNGLPIERLARHAINSLPIDQGAA
jgi:hypothetical protein